MLVVVVVGLLLLPLLLLPVLALLEADASMLLLPIFTQPPLCISTNNPAGSLL